MKTRQTSVAFPAEILAKIEDARFTYRYKTVSECIVDLVRLGLAAKTEKAPS